MEVIVFITFIWVFLAIFAASIAADRGQSGTLIFFISLMFSPVVGVISAFVSGDNMVNANKNLEQKGKIKKCPDCAEFVKSEAIVCRYCGKSFE